MYALRCFFFRFFSFINADFQVCELYLWDMVMSSQGLARFAQHNRHAHDYRSDSNQFLHLPHDTNPRNLQLYKLIKDAPKLAAGVPTMREFQAKIKAHWTANLQNCYAISRPDIDFPSLATTLFHHWLRPLGREKKLQLLQELATVAKFELASINTQEDTYGDELSTGRDGGGAVGVDDAGDAKQGDDDEDDEEDDENDEEDQEDDQEDDESDEEVEDEETDDKDAEEAEEDVDTTGPTRRGSRGRCRGPEKPSTDATHTMTCPSRAKKRRGGNTPTPPTVKKRSKHNALAPILSAIDPGALVVAATSRKISKKQKIALTNLAQWLLQNKKSF
jgi:hypothetical protein